MLLRQLRCAVEHIEEYIPCELEPSRVFTVAAIILPLGHALMAEPWGA
jgi:hypothetical protein